MLGALMLDVAGTQLSTEDIDILQHPQVGGVILFGRNIQSPQQVRALTDAIRQVRSDILIAVDQEGGRVARLRQGFTPLPAVGQIGDAFNNDPIKTLACMQRCGWLMATEVLAVGIDFSFAPVLDLNGVSQVIGDRAFHSQAHAVTALSSAYMQGMRAAGMATTAKHFPGHGSVAPDSHVAQAIDERPLADIWSTDMLPFRHNLPLCTALMPAHVIYTSVDSQPAGFSSIWLQEVLRKQLGFDGVIFSDDLSMHAAHIAGDAGSRCIAALSAGCDMVLVCNDRQSATDALERLATHPLPNHDRLMTMSGQRPDWQDSLATTCQSSSAVYIGGQACHDYDWQLVSQEVAAMS